MNTYFVFALTTFTGFFAIMNPLANTPIFMGLTEEEDLRTRKLIALKSLIIAFGIISVFTVAGSLIFELFSISLPAFRVTGGILVFMIGYHMLNGRRSPIQKPHVAEPTDPAAADAEMPAANTIDGKIDDAQLGIAVSPLATPILAGPGTIATAMSFVAGGKPSDILITLASFLVLCVITYFLFINGQRIVRFIGDEALRVVTRMMGLLLAVMGTQMVIHGIHSASQMTF
ncbi:MAG: multiple antibiotic resistance protein [Zhongshania aliphaticivorans]|jgi:multiple antibiotic resistance protein